MSSHLCHAHTFADFPGLLSHTAAPRLMRRRSSRLRSVSTMAGGDEPYLRRGSSTDTPIQRPQCSRPSSPRSSQIALDLQQAATQRQHLYQQVPLQRQIPPGWDYNRSLGSTPVRQMPPYESSADRDVLNQPQLLQVLRRATAKVVYVCRHGKLPNEEATDWNGWLSWKRKQGQSPPTGRAKSTRSVVLMTAEQYRWMQRAHFVNDTVKQLTLALNAASGATPETAGNPPPDLISTSPTVAAFSDQLARLGATSGDPQQAELDDRALLYLQQLLVEQGLTMAPSVETLTHQLVHPEMTRRATKFLVSMYKLRKAVNRAKRTKRVSDHDAVLLQANVLLDEYLMTKDSVDLDTSTTSSSGEKDRHRKQILVQHVLGAHLGDMCDDKQCLVLHVEANVSRRVERGGWCCQEIVLAGAQAQVNFLIDMTRHHESTGTQYAGMFLVHGKPQRISVMEDYYESFNLLAARTLWNTARDNVDTPVAAAAPVATDPDMIGETATPATAKKKIVRRKKAKSDDEAERRSSMTSVGGARKGKTAEAIETPAQNLPEGSRKASPLTTSRRASAGRKADDVPPRRASAGRGVGDAPPRRASAGRGAGDALPRRSSTERDTGERKLKDQTSQDPSGHLKKSSRRASTGPKAQPVPEGSQSGDPSGHINKPSQRRASTGPKDAQSVPQGSRPEKKKALRKPSGGEFVVDSVQPVKALRKPSGGEFVEETDESSEGSAYVADRRKSGDTAPSFYDVSVGSPEVSPEPSPKQSVQKTKGDGTVMNSEIIPEIEKLGKLGEEVAAILRTPSKHNRETASKTSKNSSSGKDDMSVTTSDSQPIVLRPKPPPVADSSVGADSVVLFQPSGDKISATSFRASDFNQPTTPTTAAYTNTTGSTTITSFGGSGSGSSSYKAARTPQGAGARSQSAPSGRTTKSTDPPAYRAPSQREQIAKKEMDESRNKSSRKPKKKDNV